MLPGFYWGSFTKNNAIKAEVVPLPFIKPFNKR